MILIRYITVIEQSIEFYFFSKKIVILDLFVKYLESINFALFSSVIVCRNDSVFIHRNCLNTSSNICFNPKIGIDSVDFMIFILQKVGNILKFKFITDIY